MYNALLVDDEYMILEGLKKIVVWEDFEITIIGTAKNGLEALEFMEEHTVNIVITDITMPLLSGIDFIHEAIKRGNEFKFLVLSGYQEFEFAQKSIQLGATNYLLKPINKKELEESLAKMINELKEERGYSQTHKFVVRQLLYQWLQGENVVNELQGKLNDQFDDFKEEEFTVVLIQSSRVININEWENYAEKKDFYFTIRPGMKAIYLILKTTDIYTVELELSNLTKILKNDAVLFIGSPAYSKEAVVESYNSIKEMKSETLFYQRVQKVNWYINKVERREQVEQQVQLVNKSILSRDVSKILKDLKEFANYLEKNQILPELACWHSYMLLINGYLVFDSLNSELFKKSAKEIFSTSTFYELKMLIEEKILPINALSKQLMYSELTRQAINIIQQDYKEDLKLKKVAAELHVNAMYLGQIFKKETGKSFSYYLNEYRINLAKEFLVQSNDSISDIADQVGYQNQGYFYKIFKQYIQYSPREYREKTRKEITKHLITSREKD